MAYLARNADQRGATGPNGPLSFTVEQAAAQLARSGLSWSAGPGQGTTVTYAFRASAPEAMPGDTSSFEQLSAQQIGAVERALAAWSNVANIRFVRVGTGSSGAGAYSNDAAILFAGYASGGENAAAFAYLPGSTAASSLAGDVWINQSLPYMRYPGAQYEPGHLTLVHEIGHAIGLLHPGEYDVGKAMITYADDSAYAEDSLQYSIMSYFDMTETGGAVPHPQWQPAGPLIDDIAAVQRLYGANAQGNAGNTVYGSNPYSSFLVDAQNDRSGLMTSGNSPLWGTIWDGGGIDTLDFGGSTVDQRIDLRAGAFSDVQGGIGTLSIALGTTIENAVGGNADDTILGNDAANRLLGGAGDDVLTGGRGDDLLDGGTGNDRAVIASAFAAAAFLVGDGGDTIVSSADGRDTLRGVETIAFADRSIQNAAVTGVDGLYRTYMGRGAVSGEFGYWLNRPDLNGLRAAILADSAGHANTLAAVDAIYVTHMGRSAGTAELGYWEGQVKGGTDFAAVRTIVAADAGARAYAAARIDQGYEEYFGRDPSAGELGYWGDRFASGLTMAQFRITLANDHSAGAPLSRQIADAYAFGLGRAAGDTENRYWNTQLRSGLSLQDMRHIIANDSGAPGLSDGAVKAAYHDYMGRTPSTAELSYWNGQARSGTSLADMRHAILADPSGQAHVAATVTALYREYFGRSPSAAEQTAWAGLFDQGATPDALLVTLLTDPGNRDTVQYSGSAANSVTTLSAGFAHAVVSDFSNVRGTTDADPYAGATVPRFTDRDVIDLRGTPFAGIDPLANGHAREVIGLNGERGVFISYDADHDILIRSTTLALLESANFLF